MVDGHRASTDRTLPWTRLSLTIAIAGPAVWLGGVRPETVVALAVLVAGLFFRFHSRGTRNLRIPSGLWIAGLGAVACTLQWLPFPGPIASWFAPGIHEVVVEALRDTDDPTWSRVSVIPGQTLLEVARMLALGGLFFAAAQVSWRVSATATGAAGTTVALIGLVQRGLGAKKVLGFYEPIERDLGPWDGMLTTFVNANHQASLFLLGGMATLALAYEERRRGAGSGDAVEADRHADRSMVFLGMFALQLVGLLLSYSRGALVALALVAPLALVLLFRSGHVLRGGVRTKRRVLLGLLGLGFAAVMVGQLGTWRALTTLTQTEASDAKLRTTLAALDLIPLSPGLGIGRGTFVGLFPLVDDGPIWKTYSHIESFPVSVVVEWGPLVGGAFLLGFAVWWVRAFRHNTETSRRLLLCGVLAVGLHNVFDFNLEYLGVAAPFVALCGSLAPHRRSRAPARTLAVVGMASMVAATLLGWVAVPGSWSHLRRARAGLTADDVDAQNLLRSSPLDPHYHLLLARRAAESGDWSVALTRAKVATRFLPASVDAWLLRSAAEHARGDDHASEDSLHRALENLRSVPSEETVRYLARRFGPADLANLAPIDPKPWSFFVQGLTRHSLDHAQAAAAARLSTHPTDPVALRSGARIAIKLRQFALALHHARLLRQIAPHRAHSHLLVAEAFRVSGDMDAARGALEAALEVSGLDDPGIVEETLAAVYLRRGTPADLARAEDLATAALQRTEQGEVRRRRRDLVAKIEATRKTAP